MENIYKEIIEDALWAPTADNMQNWTIVRKNNDFLLEIDKNIDAHPLDLGFGCTVLSMGGFCEYLKISANSRGFKVNWNFDDSKLQLKFSFVEEKNNKKSDLLGSLRKRRTDRRPFKVIRMNEDLRRSLLNTNKEFKTKLSFLDKDKKKIISYLSKTESLFFNSFEAFYATLKWVNLEKNSTHDQGMNIENVGIQPVEATFLKFMLRYKSLLKIMVNLIIKRVLLFKSKMNLKKSGDFLIFTTPKDESKATYFEIGRHAIRVWLILTQHKMAAQPLSLSSISCLDRLQKIRPDLVSSNLEFFEKGQELLKEEFDLDSNDIPVWMLRVGTSIDKAPLRSSRKSILSSI